MLRSLPALPARILVFLLAAACLWSMTITSAVPEKAGPNSTYTDFMLYHDIADRMVHGDGYYQAASAMQRMHDFPLKPFVTVRTPTLATLGANLGWHDVQVAVITLMLVFSLLWFREVESRATKAEAAAVVLAVLAGGMMVTQEWLIVLHELPASILLLGAMLLRGGKHWYWAVLCAAGALSIRELSLPFSMLACALSLYERRKAEAWGWAALIALFGVALYFHAGAVYGMALPTDKVSVPWQGLRGPGAVIADVVDNSLLNRLPMALAYPLTLLAMLGWAAAPLRQARFALLYFAGYALMLALFARVENFYWAVLLLPSWFIGFAFLPRGLRDLAKAALARRGPAL